MPREPAIISAASRSPSGPLEEGQGGADVGLLLAQQPQRLALLVPAQRNFGVLDDAAEVGGVAARHLDRLPGASKSFGGVLTQRLQHPVPAGGAGFDDDHGLFDEPADGVEDLAGACVLVCDDLLSRHQRPTALEDREPVEHPLLGLRQQLVAPVDGGAQRLLPFFGGAGAGGEQGEPVREPLGHLDRRQRRYPGGGELEGERDAVEGPGDGTDRAQVVGVEQQPGAHGAGPFGEQLRRRVAEHLAWRGVLRWRFQRADGDLHLVGDRRALRGWWR